ncbi:MAG: hypothetical protein E6Q89_00630 [Bacteroidia bacterium]|nr:MAG: hypothetical protein E6Q89_00630 [Bacteroidia bacterium]
MFFVLFIVILNIILILGLTINELEFIHWKIYHRTVPKYNEFLWFDNTRFQMWSLNGLSHRVDGPAHIYINDSNIKKEEYWFKGKEYAFDEWFNLLTPEQQINYLWKSDEG